MRPELLQYGLEIPAELQVRIRKKYPDNCFADLVFDEPARVSIPTTDCMLTEDCLDDIDDELTELGEVFQDLGPTKEVLLQDLRRCSALGEFFGLPHEIPDDNVPCNVFDSVARAVSQDRQHVVSARRLLGHFRTTRRKAIANRLSAARRQRSRTEPNICKMEHEDEDDDGPEELSAWLGQPLLPLPKPSRQKSVATRMRSSTENPDMQFTENLDMKPSPPDISTWISLATRNVKVRFDCGSGDTKDADLVDEEVEDLVKLAELRKVFRDVDVNQDGRINKRELIKALRRCSAVARFFHLPKQIRAEDGSRDAFERLFQAMDTDCSRELSWDEFLVHFQELRSTHRDSTQSDSAESSNTPHGADVRSAGVLNGSQNHETHARPSGTEAFPKCRQEPASPRNEASKCRQESASPRYMTAAVKSPAVPVDSECATAAAMATQTAIQAESTHCPEDSSVHSNMWSAEAAVAVSSEHQAPCREFQTVDDGTEAISSKGFPSFQGLPIRHFDENTPASEQGLFDSSPVHSHGSEDTASTLKAELCLECTSIHVVAPMACRPGRHGFRTPLQAMMPKPDVFVCPPDLLLYLPKVPPSTPSAPLKSWATETVHAWVATLPFTPPEVAEVLLRECVNGFVLSSLSDQDLSKIGVRKFGWCRQLVLFTLAVQQWQAHPNAEDARCRSLSPPVFRVRPPDAPTALREQSGPVRNCGWSPLRQLSGARLPIQATYQAPKAVAFEPVCFRHTLGAAKVILRQMSAPMLRNTIGHPTMRRQCFDDLIPRKHSLTLNQ